MSYTQVGSLTSFSSGTTIVSSEVNQNFSDIRDVVNALVTGANTIEADTINEVTAAQGVNIDGLLIKDGGLEPFSVSGADGIDFNPGSDTDVDLITVGVTGAPKIYWDESEDRFRTTKGVDVTAGLFVVSGTGAVINALAVTGNADIASVSGTVGFFGATGQNQQTVSGSYDGNPALANLLVALDNLGLIDDQTTPS